MKNLFTLLIVLLIGQVAFAQTTEELQQMKEEKSAELTKLKGELDELTGKVDALKGEVASLTDQLTPYPRWDKGVLGTLGMNFSNFNDIEKEGCSLSCE